MPKLTKFNPISGLKKMFFSLSAYVELLKAAVKVIVVGDHLLSGDSRGIADDPAAERPTGGSHRAAGTPHRRQGVDAGGPLLPRLALLDSSTSGGNTDVTCA